MDFGRLMFEPPEVADTVTLPSNDFDFYGAFLQVEDVDVHGGFAPSHAQQQQQQHQQHQQHHHHHPRHHHFHDDFDDDMAYVARGGSPSTAMAPLPGTRTLRPSFPYQLAPVLPSNSAVMPAPGRSAAAAAAAADRMSPPPTRAVSRAGGGRAVGRARRKPVPQAAAVRQTSRSPSVGPGLGLGLGPEPDPETVTLAALVSSRRVERRGHTKSRRGCFNCKRRRIKCQETRPACGHCLKTGLQCEYPIVPLVNHQPQHQIPLFSLQDMRFFQHFLEHCCPHHPLSNETLWTHEIPYLSHTYDYLMHALLGLAASDLMQQDASLAVAAMDHRLKAIRAMKRMLATVSKQQRTTASVSGGTTCATATSPAAWDGDGATTDCPLYEEGNALVAACFALTFQSVLLDDGLAEYMTFIRGILVVGTQMYLNGARLLFRNILGQRQQELLRPVLEPMAGIDPRLTRPAIAAIRRLAPLCRGSALATTFQARLQEMAEALLVSPMEAYAAVTRHYAWWMMLPQRQFRQLIDFDHPVFVLLAAHWIGVKLIMAPVLAAEDTCDERPEEERQQQQQRRHQQDGGGGGGGMDPGIARWLRYLNRQLDLEYAQHNEWPRWVEAELDRDPCAFRRQEEEGEEQQKQNKKSIF